MAKGFVSLVGAGPGDPGLLTLHGRDRLAQAEVVLYDRLIGSTLLDHAQVGAERIFVGKSPERKAMTQEEINARLVTEGLAGKRVVRLKGGDPFVFGRGGEEALALAAAGVPYEVIPGVTSSIAAPAYAGVPVTHRGLASSFAVVTGHEDDEKDESSVQWSGLATAVDTIVVLMGGAALPSVSAALIRGGRDPRTPAVSIEWGTTAGQRSVSAPLESIASAVKGARLGTPLLTVIGQVASLHDQLAWFESKPLLGKRVLVTRTRQQSSALAELLRREGALPVELPALELARVASEAELATCAALLDRGEYGWCLFTSFNAVEHFFSFLDRSERDARSFAGCRVVSLGSATSAALKKRGVRPDLEATEFSSDGLLDTLGDLELRDAHVLLPRAEAGSPALIEGLRNRGAEVDEIVLYQTRAPAEADPEIVGLIRDGKVDVATFASSSSVQNLAMLLGDNFRALESAVIASIGPVTSTTVREQGLAVDVEPSEHTIPALVEALKTHFAKSSRV